MTDYTTKAARDALMGSIAAEYYLAAVPPSEARLLAAVRNLKDACDALEARAEAAEKRAEFYAPNCCDRIAALEKALRDALERYQAVIESEWSPGFTDAQWKKEPEVADLWAVLEGKP